MLVPAAAAFHHHHTVKDGPSPPALYMTVRAILCRLLTQPALYSSDLRQWRTWIITTSMQPAPPPKLNQAVPTRSDKSLQSLRGAAQLFAGSDRLDKAAGLLDEITRAEPSDDSAWQNLVRLAEPGPQYWDMLV